MDMKFSLCAMVGVSRLSAVRRSANNANTSPTFLGPFNDGCCTSASAQTSFKQSCHKRYFFIKFLYIFLISLGVFDFVCMNSAYTLRLSSRKRLCNLEKEKKAALLTHSYTYVLFEGLAHIKIFFYCYASQKLLCDNVVFAARMPS